MKDKSFIIFYLFLGLYCGFLLGASLDKGSSLLIGKILYAAAILLVGLFGRRIDQRSHQHHMEVWHELRRKGKWYFVLTRYVLWRGGILLLLFGAPVSSVMRFEATVVKVLALVAGVLVLMMVFLGHIEWRYCEEDFEILALKRAAEEARQDAAMYN
jgi:hypothetical protein